MSAQTSPTVPGSRPAPALPWPALLALSAAAFTAVTTELLPAGLLPAMSADLGVSEARIGFLVTGFAVTGFLTAIPVTAAVRGLPRRPVLVAVLCGFALLNLVTAVSSAYPLTFAARVLAGVMGGTLWAMLVGYAARTVPPERRGRAIAVVSAGITLALCAGLPAGAAVAAATGWRAAFAALALLAGLLALVVRWQAPALAPEPPASRTPLRRVATLPGARTALAVTVVVILAHHAVYTYLAPLAGPAWTGVTLLVFGLSTVAGVWATGVVIDRHPRRALLTALALVAVTMTLLGLTGHPAALLGGAILWGVAFGGIPTLLQTALINATGAANADVATSMQTTVYNLGIAAGSFAGGLVLDASGAAALPWTALPLLAAALVTVALARRHAFPR
ncbi:MFS transporter [Nonomuraea sp. MCN248]|uniref:MFS transporter n=1 Tax=Nonomuraea corallina TaxID=2989783 RepID=A0ABT4S4C1_9ACTN|nr:MFS transporter [Nonomuraea corallina]MDA0631990.1 MFS transporter [Nonomuraea corallina]